MTALTAEGRGENKNVVRLYLLPNAAQAACYRRKACAVSKTTVRIRQNWSTVQPADKMVRVMQLAFLQVGYCRTPNSTHKAPLLTCQSFQTTKKRSFLQLGHCVLLRPCVPQSLYPVSSLCTAVPVSCIVPVYRSPSILHRPCVPQSLYPVSSMCTAVPVSCIVPVYRSPYIVPVYRSPCILYRPCVPQSLYSPCVQQSLYSPYVP